MIKLLRRIRYDLIQKNKTGKYLKYALGEIVLVVIGILIALSINNWNHDRIERYKEYSILNELIVDLEEQSSLLDEYIDIESGFYRNGLAVLKYFSANQTFYGNDSIYAKLNSLATRKTFNPIRTTFQELISTGTIGIIQDKSTKRKIIQYYHELERISMVIGNNNIHIVDAIYQPEVLQRTLFVLDDDFPDLKKMNDPIFDEESLVRVRTTSKNELANDKNILHLFNILEQRTRVAGNNIESYKTIKSNTEELILEIRGQVDARRK